MGVEQAAVAEDEHVATCSATPGRGGEGGGAWVPMQAPGSAGIRTACSPMLAWMAVQVSGAQTSWHACPLGPPGVQTRVHRPVAGGVVPCGVSNLQACVCCPPAAPPTWDWRGLGRCSYHYAYNHDAAGQRAHLDGRLASAGDGDRWRRLAGLSLRLQTKCCVWWRREMAAIQVFSIVFSAVVMHDVWTLPGPRPLLPPSADQPLRLHCLPL